MAQAQVRLRAITEADLPDLVRWTNDPEVVRFMGGEAGNATIDGWRDWLARVSASDSADRPWAVEVDGQLVGNCRLKLDPKGETADYVIMIGRRDAWGKGYGTAATREALRRGFQEMGLHRIHLRCFPENRKGIRCYEKAGFRREGCERQSYLKSGEWRDLVLMAILREEWEAGQESRDRRAESVHQAGSIVRLRAITEADLADYVAWLNDPEVTRFTQIESGGVTLEGEREWFRHITGPDSKTRNWAIEADGRHIGNCALIPDESGEMAGFGIIIGDKTQWNRGCGTAALREVLRIGFGEMGLQRIHLTALAANGRGIRCYEKCGFRHEGVRRRHFLKRGKWEDVVCMGILREEWEAEQCAKK